MAKFFEYSRFIIIVLGSFFAYTYYSAEPVELLHIMMLIIVVSLSGLTGIEGAFFSNATAISLGRTTGSPYQKQSAMNNLAVALVGIFVWFADWGRYADAAVMMCTLCFITLSACVHTWEALTQGNKSRKNMLRGVWTLALLFLCVPVLIGALK